MLKYIVVGDIGAHDGHIEIVEMDDIWNGENPTGWTWQDITGPHGSVIGECDTEAEAKQVLGDFLHCDARENGRYCFTHNPF